MMVHLAALPAINNRRSEIVRAKGNDLLVALRDCGEQ